MPPHRPLGLSDHQLTALFAVGALVAYSDRDHWLRAVAHRLQDQPVTDAADHAVLSGTNAMLIRDVIHRLRLRANQAQAQGQEHLAQDLRLALDALIRLDRDAQLMRPTLARPQISA